MASKLVASFARAARSRRSPLLVSSSVRAFATEALVVPDDRFTRYSSPVPVAIDHTDVLGVPPTKVTTLANGLRVASQAVPLAETATVGVWIDAGSRFETDASNGTAHFLEHMIFKGTGKRTVRQLEEQIENMGAHLDAYTSREQTTYLAKVLKKDIPGAVEILSDILQKPAFDAKNLERERNVILREMEEVGKQPNEVMFDHLHATAFQFTPLGRTILGPAENIRSLTKDDLTQYIKTHYSGPRMVVAAAGGVDHDALVSLVEKSFTSLSTDPTTAADLVAKEPAVFTGSDVRYRDDDMPLAHFIVAVAGAKWTDPDAIGLMVMQAMLGSWDKASGAGTNMGSEMAQMVASNNLAESVMSFNTNFADAGLFGVYAVAQPDHLDDLSYAIMHEMTKMVYQVKEEDVIRARNQLKASLLLHLDGTSAIAEDIGRQLLIYGRRMSLAEMFARIDAVDAATVKRVADRFIFDKEVAVAAMGPTQFLPDLNWFRRRTFWLRY
eukprot:TRINITY_DN36202_c0_g1_i1.p1 TRINITY_DN36202_c0_g1~~TRINITY_DN36202_c0_g1_i1.p1  ORF type:complete len:516 (+),score=87.62 TRINITY_DN36202_c0_g1_i1:55-1548(+)